MERINELMSEETSNTTDTVHMIHEVSEHEVVVTLATVDQMKNIGYKIGKYNWTPKKISI